MIEFQELHLVVTLRTLKGIVTKGEEKKLAPFVKIQQGSVVGFRDSPAEVFVRVPVSCIKPVITDGLEMFFGDMLDEEGNEVQHRERFLHVGAVFMLIVMEGDMLTVIRINA